MSTFRKFDAFAVLAETNSTPTKVGKAAEKPDADSSHSTHFSNFSNFSSHQCEISKLENNTTLATLASLAVGKARSQRRLTENVNRGATPAKVAKPAKAVRPNSHLGANPESLDEERAAIIEFEADVPPEWASGLARLGVMAKPDGVSLKRWQRLVENANTFVHTFGPQAVSLGWDALSVFGCSAIAPAARLDLAGLLFFIAEGEVIAIASATAKIKTKHGKVLTFTRTRRAAGERCIPVWELSQAGNPR